ncbi:MAG TPA: glycosyltransferase family 4 protein [Fimbriimonadaceae bacterium]|nr:glycosyltransferase family 4 protein [Fimbriimonadaceae bacterium]
MKVLQIGSSLFDWGGIERYVAYLAEGLIERGHEVTVACPPGSPLALRSPGEKLAVPLRLQYSYWLVPKFVQLLRKGQYDVAHVHFSPDFVIPLLAARMAHVPRVVMTRHVALPWPAAKVTRYGEKVDRIVCVSDAVHRTLSSSGVRNEKLVVAKAGCPALKPTSAVDRLRKELTGNGSLFAVGYFGRLVADKGVQHLVEAAKSLPPGVVVHIFGEGPMRSSIEAAAKDSRITYHGFVPDIADAMASVDLVAIPSVWAEAFPFAALEAMSLGKPILATRRGGLPEMVLDGETGRLVEAEDPAVLAAAILELSRQPSALRHMGQRAKAIQEETYTIDAFAKRIEAVYEAIQRT